jgi:peroxiredoxin Q/BCP
MATALQPGDKAPDFALSDDEGGEIRLKDLSGKAVVLYFYPKDDTPGCTTEAQGFTAAADDFAAAGAVVVGVSKDSAKSHGRFRQKYGLKVRLGADVEGQVVERYGVWVEKSMYGRQYMGIERATFLIDAAGVIRRVWRKVSVKGHAQEVLAAVRDLGAS